MHSSTAMQLHAAMNSAASMVTMHAHPVCQACAEGLWPQMMSLKGAPLPSFSGTVFGGWSHRLGLPGSALLRLLLAAGLAAPGLVCMRLPVRCCLSGVVVVPACSLAPPLAGVRGLRCCLTGVVLVLGSSQASPVEPLAAARGVGDAGRRIMLGDPAASTAGAAMNAKPCAQGVETRRAAYSMKVLTCVVVRAPCSMCLRPPSHRKHVSRLA